MTSPMPVRTIAKTNRSIDKTIEVKSDFDSLKALLVERAKALSGDATQGKTKEVYLLSFHDDGVVWGKLDNKGELKTSDRIVDSPSPKFRIDTLQECRLFSERGELLIWRTNEMEFKARQIFDEGKLDDDEIESDGKTRYFDEPQVLWGREIDDKFTSASEDFTVVREGQGVRHPFPMQRDKLTWGEDADETKRPRPLRMCVRHYISYDDDGCAYIALSRLTQISIEGA